MSEYESTLLPIKTCDYCGTRGTMCTFANGETLCDKCMKELPITCTEARKEVYRLRAENQQQAERINELEQLGERAADMISKQADDKLRIAEQLETAEKGAARYNFIRQNRPGLMLDAFQDGYGSDGHAPFAWQVELDAAIDEAITTNNEGE